MILSLTWVLLLAAPLSAATQYISQQGLYILASDIIGDDALSSSGIITVSGSNITIDLDGHTITQESGINSSVHGIHCTPNTHNITIKNGCIRGVSGNGVRIEQGSSNIRLENIDFIDCLGGHVSSIGTAAATTTGIIIDACSYSASTTLIPSYIISITHNSNVMLHDLLINDIAAPQSPLTGIAISQCSGVLIENATLAGIAAKKFTGIVVHQSPNSSLEQCFIHDCMTTETCIGITITGSQGASISQMEVHDFVVSGSNTEAIGFLCLTNDGCNFTRCIARSIKAQGLNSLAYGFKVIDSDRILQQNCTASLVETTLSGGDAYGILWSNVSFSALIESIIDDTRAVGQGFGMLATSVSESEINGNQFLNTAGGTLRRGLRVVSGTRNLFTKNIAFRNGSSATEQIEGLASGTTDFNTATGNISTIGSPWTNIRAF